VSFTANLFRLPCQCSVAMARFALLVSQLWALSVVLTAAQPPSENCDAAGSCMSDEEDGAALVQRLPVDRRPSREDVSRDGLEAYSKQGSNKPQGPEARDSAEFAQVEAKKVGGALDDDPENATMAAAVNPNTVQCAPGCGSKSGTKCPLVVGLHGMGDPDASKLKYMLFGYNEALLFADASYCITFLTSTSGQDWDLVQDSSPDFQRVVSFANTAIAQYNIDTSAVYLFGYSNGGCLGYSLMCGGLIDTPFVSYAAIEAQSLYTTKSSGQWWVPPEKVCCPNAKFHLMAVQGTADTVFPMNQVQTPAFCATQSALVTQHGKDNSCQGPTSQQATLMPNTKITAYENKCKADGSASLYTVTGGTHSSVVTNALWKEVWNFFTIVAPASGR